MRITIAGAGISGLSLAYAIQEKLEAAGKSAEIFLLEADGRVGGKIRTHHEDGYIMEWGPNGFLNNKPDTLALTRKLGIEELLLPSNDAARKRYIYSGGRLNLLSPAGFVLGGLLSWRGKIRILKEYGIPRRTDASDESLADFVRRRLGREALDRLIGPMAMGVYGGDPERMALKSCFPTIYDLEQKYGGLFKGMLGKMKEKKQAGGGIKKAGGGIKKAGGGKVSGPAGPGGVLTTFYGGLDVLTDALGKAFTGKLLLNAPVREVRRVGAAGADEKFIVSAGGLDAPLETEIFITAAPAHAAKDFLAALDPQLTETLSEIEYVPMSVVGMGFKKTELNSELDGFGFLVAMDEARKLIGCLWDSSVFTDRAPAGRASIRAMLGGGKDFSTPFLPDGQLLELTLEELRITMALKSRPELTRVFRHERAIPMYTLGHSERLNKLDKGEDKYRGLFFAGNAYRGVGLNDCVKDAYSVAEKILRLA
ncbi:MAG: protoporphyrinogen oxidase [Nitrospirota bacterium]